MVLEEVLELEDPHVLSTSGGVRSVGKRLLCVSAPSGYEVGEALPKHEE